MFKGSVLLLHMNSVSYPLRTFFVLAAGKLSYRLDGKWNIFDIFNQVIWVFCNILRFTTRKGHFDTPGKFWEGSRRSTIHCSSKALTRNIYRPQPQHNLSRWCWTVEGWITLQDASSTQNYSPFLYTLEPTCKVHGYKVFSHVRSVYVLSKSEILILASNPDIRSACFYGQFSLDKMRALQGGSSVYGNLPL